MIKGIDYPAIFVCGICHDGEGNVLYTHRSEKARDEQGRWNIGAGGTLELGETLEECLSREVKEETDADIKEKEYIGHRELFREKDGIESHWIGHYFKVLVDRKQIKIMEDVFDGMLWQSFHDMPTPMISHYDQTYELFKSHF
jgi:8-oxo-dGTP pyrophosphatase MutT (NUDIX family)